MPTKKRKNSATTDATAVVSTSLFETVIENLEAEDQAAAKLRKQQSVKDVARAKAARSQSKIYGHLMETRILLQRALEQKQQQQLQLQQNSSSIEEDDDDNSEYVDNDGGDEKKRKIDKNKNQPLIKECNHLLDQLLQARRQLTGILPETNDTSLDDNERLQAEYKTCREQWKEVLNRRHGDLRLRSGVTSKTQFRVLDASFWQQVEATVNHEAMRQQQQQQQQHTTNPSTNFDDAKVYQQMLKDFLVLASSSSANENSLSYQRWKSPHPKKKVDRKASKGRKIRYVEIPKLVNFTFPVSRASTSNLNEDEWFQSLFGGAAAAEAAAAGSQPQGIMKD